MNLRKDQIQELVASLIKSNEWRFVEELLADKREDLVNRLINKEDECVRGKIQFIDEFIGEIKDYSNPKEEIHD